MVEDLVGWVAAPLVLYALSLGLGLLVQRLSGARVHPGLLAPLGFCALLLVTMASFQLGGHGWLAAAVAVGLAVGGFVAARHDLRDQVRPRWPVAAALGAYMLFVAPVVLTGHWTWLGYNFVNDTSVFYMLVEHLQDAGTSVPPRGVSTFDQVIAEYLDTNYPLGTYAGMAALGELIRVPPEVFFQPFIAVEAGLAAMSLTVLGARLVRAPWAALAAVVAVVANLAYQFALQGAVKEIGMITTLVTAAALGRELLDAERPRRAVVGLALALAAGLAVFATAAAPYLLFTALAVLVAALVRRGGPLRRDLLRTTGVGIATLLVALAPTIPALIDFIRVAEAVHGSGSAQEPLGQLARPLLLSQVTGTWLGDYTVPIEEKPMATATTVLVVLTAIAFVIGLLVLWRRREGGPLLVLAPAALTSLVLFGQVTPYAEAKTLVILSVPVVLIAMLGAIGLGRAWRRLAVPGAALACVVAAGVLASAAEAYHLVRVAPVDRLEALEQAGRRLDQPGDVSVNESEEFAKYLVRQPRLQIGSEALTPRFVEPREGQINYLSWADLDAQTLRYVESFDGWLLRRSPANSRPPANFDRVYRNDFYEVWAKRRGLRVLEHLPLQAMDTRALPADACGELRRLAAAARRPGRELLAAVRPEVALFDVTKAPFREAGWPPNGNIRQPGTLTLAVPGQAAGTVEVQGGLYDVWVRGSTGRNMEVLVDGRRVGAARGLDTPMQFSPGGVVRLSPGRHEIIVRRPGGTLRPGDGTRAWLGPVALERVGGPRVQRVDPADAGALCGRTLDWVEVVQRAP